MTKMADKSRNEKITKSQLETSCNLPKLPVPPLDQTLQRYLHSVQALVPPLQFDITREIVEEFGRGGGEGQHLQDKLVDIASCKDSWAYDWWMDDMYMRNRVALPVNSNPGMVFEQQDFQGPQDQIRNELPIDRATSREKGQPLCMSQHYRLLRTYRAPGPTQDFHIITKGNRKDEHIIVAFKNSFFALDVVIDGVRVGDRILRQQIGNILKESECGVPIGILTTNQRGEWARARDILLRDSTNATSLECIESSMLVVCLDQAWPKSFNRLDDVKDGRDDVSKALQMIHGGGATLSSANRWFDKTLQIVIGVDGVCGLSYEHSPAEGVVVIQLMEDILKCWDKEKANDYYTKDDKENGGLAINVARRLHWNICNDVMNAISAAAGNLYKMVEELDFYVLRFEEYGRDFAKIQKTSPDVFVQIALQLTYYKVHRRLVATYESASTRRFRLGRVDNIRASTPEVLSWVRAMVGETEVDNEEKVRLFRTAANIQTEILTYNILGQGIDCHLLGLRELAKDLQYPTPQIFKDETYLISNRFMLSTSQVTTSTDSFMGYGPVVPDGYGASYNLQPTSMLFCISSFKSFEDTDSEMFAMSLEGSLLQIRELLERNQDMCKTR